MQKVKIEPFHLIGLSIRTTNENNQAATDIANLWGRFMSEDIVSAIPNKIDNTVYSLYTAYEGDHTKPYTAILGCKVKSLDQVPKELTGESIEGGEYVKITANGDLTKGLIVDQWAKIWEMDLNRVYTADFEVFGEKAQNPNDAEVDFMVAVS